MNDVIGTITHAIGYAASVRPRIGGFPYLAEALRQAGVEAYLFDVPSQSVVYLTQAGDVLQPGTLITGETILIPAFDEPRLVAAIRADQAGETTFHAFVQASFRAGVVRYEVDTTARTCTYLGGHGEHFVESYPAVDLVLPTTPPPPGVCPTV